MAARQQAVLLLDLMAARRLAVRCEVPMVAPQRVELPWDPMVE